MTNHGLVTRNAGKVVNLGHSRDSRGAWRYGEPLLRHISFFWDVPPARIIAETTLPEEIFDIVALSKRAETPEFDQVVRRLIEVTFQISVTPEKRTTEVYILRPLPGREPQLGSLTAGFYTDEATGLHPPNKAVL